MEASLQPTVWALSLCSAHRRAWLSMIKHSSSEGGGGKQQSPAWSLYEPVHGSACCEASGSDPDENCDGTSPLNLRIVGAAASVAEHVQSKKLGRAGSRIVLMMRLLVFILTNVERRQETRLLWKNYGPFPSSPPEVLRDFWLDHLSL